MAPRPGRALLSLKHTALQCGQTKGIGPIATSLNVQAIPIYRGLLGRLDQESFLKF